MSTPVAEEQVLYKSRTHPKILFRPALAQLGLLVLHILVVRYFPERIGIDGVDRWGEVVAHSLIGLGELWYAVRPTMHWWHSTYEVTNRRVRIKWGVFYKNSREINLDRITQVNEERGILDRIFRCGTIIVFDAANTEAIRLHDVPRFHAVRVIIDESRFRAQSQRWEPTDGPR